MSRQEMGPEERWERGITHDPRSEAIARGIADVDLDYGDHLDLKFGGDGDNGEQLLYLLDVYFARLDRIANLPESA